MTTAAGAVFESATYRRDMALMMGAVASVPRPTTCRGRRRTALLLVAGSIDPIMTLLTDHAPRHWVEPLRTPLTTRRRRSVLGLGALTERRPYPGNRMVPAEDVTGSSWWIPAAAVWTDGDLVPAPQVLNALGLAVAPERNQAILAGLSDRLGREAIAAHARGRGLPAYEGPRPADAADLVLLDGRVGHDVPTVVAVLPSGPRGGAGATWEVAMDRARFGHRCATDDAARELTLLVGLLATGGLGVVTVDLATARLGGQVARCSVHVVVANDDPGRPWTRPDWTDRSGGGGTWLIVRRACEDVRPPFASPTARS